MGSIYELIQIDVKTKTFINIIKYTLYTTKNIQNNWFVAIIKSLLKNIS